MIIDPRRKVERGIFVWNTDNFSKRRMEEKAFAYRPRHLRWIERPPKHALKNRLPFGQFSSYKNDSVICINGKKFCVDRHPVLKTNMATKWGNP